jgi:hypothetical protein
MTNSLGAVRIDLPTLGETDSAPKDRIKESIPTPNRMKESRKKDLTPALVNTYNQVGAVLCMIPRTREDGRVIIENAEVAASALADYAERNASVYKALEKLLNASGVGAVVAAHIPIMIGIMANHNVSIPGLAYLVSENDDGSSDTSANAA